MSARGLRFSVVGACLPGKQETRRRPGHACPTCSLTIEYDKPVCDRRASNWLLAGSDTHCSASRTPPSARTFSPYRSSLTTEYDNPVAKPLPQPRSPGHGFAVGTNALLRAQAWRPHPRAIVLRRAPRSRFRVPGSGRARCSARGPRG